MQHFFSFTKRVYGGAANLTLRRIRPVGISHTKVVEEMSGIYGAWSAGKEAGSDRAARALTLLADAHRAYGRDAAENAVVREGLGMGCCVNHIPEDCPAPPPVLRAGPLTAVIDALLYNREELLERFRDGRDRTAESDEQLLLDVYRMFGADALAGVNGDFAGAVYDSRVHTLTLFRDHLGVRPLFYGIEGGFAAFGTDEAGVSSLPGFTPLLNEALFYLDHGGYSAQNMEETCFAQFRAVPPACVLTLSPTAEGGFFVQKKAYWKLGAAKIRLKTEQDYIAAMRALIKDAVARRLARVKNVVGAELSGGLDSSVIDVLIHRMGREAIFFSWSPDTTVAPLQKDDEREMIALVCEQEGVTCHFNPAQDSVETAVDRLSANPFTDNIYRIFEEGVKFFAAAGARIAFSGWGGDEGVSHRAHMVEMPWHGEILPYLRELKFRTGANPIRAARMLREHVRVVRNKLEPWNGYRANRSPETPCLDRAFVKRMEPIVQKERLWFGTHPIRQIEGGGNRTREELAAKEGAKHGIQYVFPYLDYRVEDFAVSIPRWLFVHHGQNRYIYRRAFQDIVPEKLINSTDKSDPGRSAHFFETSFQMLRGVGEYVLPRLNRAFGRVIWILTRRKRR